MGFVSLCKSIISEYFLCGKYPLLLLKKEHVVSQRKIGRTGRSIPDAQSLQVYLIQYNTQVNLITEFSNHYLA